MHCKCHYMMWQPQNDDSSLAIYCSKSSKWTLDNSWCMHRLQFRAHNITKERVSNSLHSLYKISVSSSYKCTIDHIFTLLALTVVSATVLYANYMAVVVNYSCTVEARLTRVNQTWTHLWLCDVVSMYVYCMHACTVFGVSNYWNLADWHEVLLLKQISKVSLLSLLTFCN